MPFPSPSDKEGKNDFVGRCVSFVDKEGKIPHKQAVAACLDTWMKHQKKKLDEELRDSIDELKHTSKKIRKKRY